MQTGTRYLDNFDLALTVDIAEAWGFGSGTLYAYGLHNNWQTLADELVGDFQVVSNIDAPGATRLFEFWYEFGSEHWSVRTGLYDLNSEFDTHETGALFTNSSHGIGAELAQTGENGPSIFPISSLGIRWTYQFETMAIRAVVLDGVPGNPNDPSSNQIHLSHEDGVLSVAEIDWWAFDDWRVWAGIWAYSAEFEKPYDAGVSDDNRGAYIGIEWQTSFAARDVNMMLRYGIANEEINPLRAYLGAALVITDPFLRGVNDQLGLAVGSALAGNPYRRYVAANRFGAENFERNLELTYRFPVSEWLSLQPIVQYVEHPSATSSIKDALLVGLRFEMSWGAAF